MTKTDQLKKLNQLVLDNLIDIEDFYVVDLDSSRISFQGDLSRRKLVKYQELANIEFDAECGWFKGSKDGIRIVLTID
jgi:hypothetical protein